MRRILLSILGISACTSASLFAGKSDNVCSKCKQQAQVAAYDESDDDSDEGMRQQGMRQGGMRQQGMKREEGMGRTEGMKREEGMGRTEGMRRDEEGVEPYAGSAPGKGTSPGALRTSPQPGTRSQLNVNVRTNVNKLENMTPIQAHRSLETLRKNDPAMYRETMKAFTEKNGVGPVEYARLREAENSK